MGAASHEYESLLKVRSATAASAECRERIAGRLRIGAFILLVAHFFVLPTSNPWFILWIMPAFVLFIVAIGWHRRIVRSHALARRAADYFQRGLDRLNNNWVGRGPAGERHIDPEHPYSSDLDVFGRGSLFQFLCAAHTPVGQDTLAEWLKHPADRSIVLERQAAIAELSGNLDLREALGTLADPDRKELKTRHLLSWPSAPLLLTSRLVPIVAIVLGILGLFGIIAWAALGIGPSPLILVGIIEIIFLSTQWSKISEVTRESTTVLAELQAFQPPLRLLEDQRFQSPSLVQIRERLLTNGEGPSARIGRLANMLDAWDSAMRNQFVLPFTIIFMLPVHLAYAIERWRLRDGRQVRTWLEAVGEFEALCSFATFSYEHPECPFAEIAEDGPLFEAETLAHPLLPTGKRVGNNVSMSRSPALLLISGSNMAGKSTLMRSVGLNVVLALAGGPVCARRMRVSKLAVATAMRQSDSIHEGVSAFYAEIRRLQSIREWAKGPTPVLFLLDEILRGTNSHDRRVGAEAVIRILLGAGGIGMVSTHDLTLAEIVEELGDQAVNVHFEDQFIDGQMKFDYQLRPGVVPRGNGLVLMKLLGFEV